MVIVYVVRDAAGNVQRVVSSEPLVSDGEWFEVFDMDEDE